MKVARAARDERREGEWRPMEKERAGNDLVCSSRRGDGRGVKEKVFAERQELPSLC